MADGFVKDILAVLAFVVAFYALLARERKTPYITNFLFPPAALFIIAAMLDISTSMVFGASERHSTEEGGVGAFVLRGLHLASYLAKGLFVIGIFWIINNIWRLHNRQIHFRDDNRLKNLRPVRWVKNLSGRVRTKPSYEHNGIAVDQTLLLDVLKRNGFEPGNGRELKTLVSCGESFSLTDRYTAQIAYTLLQAGWMVQYTTCARHPIEWIDGLKAVMGEDGKRWANHIVVVDGYTPHFGFTDSIHIKKAAEIQSFGSHYVSTSESFAGVHTATARAFNTFKKSSDSEVLRKPQFLIYEGSRALADLESMEQYRVFLRHVITSERMWGSMVTLIVEPEADEDDERFLAAYADCLHKTDKE